MNFLRCNSLDQDRKSVLMDLMDGMAAGKLETGGDGCSCAALQSIKGRTAPCPPQLHGWHCMAPGPVQGSSSELPSRTISACLSCADSCWSAGKLCLSQGGKRGAVVDYRSFRNVQLCFPFTEVRSWSSTQQQWQESWNSSSAAMGINGVKAFPCAAAAQHSVPSADKNEIGSVFTCSAGYAPVNPWGCWHAQGTAALLLPAQQAVFQRKPPCSATASLLHSSGWKMFSLMLHQETC